MSTLLNLYVCIYVCMSVCAYVCMCVRVDMSAQVASRTQQSHAPAPVAFSF